MRFDVAKLLTKNVISLDNSITLIGVHGILSSGTFAQVSVNLKFGRIKSIKRTTYNPERSDNNNNNNNNNNNTLVYFIQIHHSDI